MTEVILWRDYGRPETVLGTRSVPSLATVAEFYAEGARHAVLPSLVDLAADAEASTVRSLTLVRELTAWGIAVDWRLRLPGDAEMWPALGHLHPVRIGVLGGGDGQVPTAQKRILLCHARGGECDRRS